MNDEQVQHRPGCDVYAGYKRCTCGIEWKIPDPTPRYNMAGGCITPAALMGTIARSGLKWKMHTAQKLAIEFNAVYALVGFMEEAKSVNTEREDIPNIPYPSVITLMGLPIEIDDTMSKQKIELWAGDKLLHVIEALAVPSVMMVYPDDYTQE